MELQRPGHMLPPAPMYPGMYPPGMMPMHPGYPGMHPGMAPSGPGGQMRMVPMWVPGSQPSPGPPGSKAKGKEKQSGFKWAARAIL